MPRRSSGGRSAPRAPPRPAPVRNPPQPASRAPPPAPAQGGSGGSMLGGLGSTIAQGMAFGSGSAMAHRAVDAVMGPRTIQHETVASEAAAAAPAPGMSSVGGSDACSVHTKAFQDCLNNYGSDISKCQFYLDMLAECLILLLAGACLGTLAKVSDETFGALGYTYTVIAVSLLCKIAALRSFSLDKLHYWRESASGMSSLAYFLSKDTIDHFNTVVKPLVYLSMFYFFNNPRSSFMDNYIVLVCLVYCVTGIAYVFAIFLEPGPAQLWSVLLPVVLTLIATQQKDSGVMKNLANLCYTKWALEAFVIANAERYSGVWLITRCGSLLASGYDLHDWPLCIVILIVTGVVSRFLAFFCIVTFQKK